MIELPPDAPPEPFLQELGAGGAQVVSLNPLRDTLEDYFVQSVGSGRGSGDGALAVRTIALVAGAVFKESVRDRVPYSMVAFAALLMAASYLISQLTAGQDLKIIKDLGLAAISWFGLLIAIFIGIGLVSKEVERRSVYALLSKPVTRGQFILGKYAGLVFTLVVNLLGDDRGVCRGAGLHGRGHGAGREGRLAGAGARSAAPRRRWS